MTNSFKGVQHVYRATFLLAVSHNVLPIINNREIKYTQKT